MEVALHVLCANQVNCYDPNDKKRIGLVPNYQGRIQA
jgi:hypothetical protein